MQVPVLHKISMDNQHMLIAAHRLLRCSEPAIKYFLRSVVFPLVTRCREAKLSATGQVLGGEMLFRHRLGCVVGCSGWSADGVTTRHTTSPHRNHRVTYPLDCDAGSRARRPRRCLVAWCWSGT